MTFRFRPFCLWRLAALFAALLVHIAPASAHAATLVDAAELTAVRNAPDARIPAAAAALAHDRDTAHRDSAHRPLLLIALVDGLDVDHWLSNPPPFLYDASRRGGIAFLSVRTDGPRTPAAVHLSLGAGAPSRTPPSTRLGPTAGLALDADELYLGMPARAIHGRWLAPEAATGTGDDGEPAIVHLAFSHVDRLNRGRSSGSVPGALGEAWRRGDVRVTVLGNSDVPGERRRYGALFAMDRRGYVMQGRVGRTTLTSDDDFPFGPRTDYARLTEESLRFAPTSDVLIVELGDLARLQPFYPAVLPAVYQAYYRQSLTRIDGFLRELVASLEPDIAERGLSFWFIAPTPGPLQQQAGLPVGALLHSFYPPAERDARPGQLGATFAAQATGSTAGPPSLLRSPSTRRPGVVSGNDVIPALLAAVHGEPHRLRPVETPALNPHLPVALPQGVDAWEAMNVFYRRAGIVHTQRLPLLRTYVILTIATMLGWGLWLFLRKPYSTRSEGREPRGTVLLLFLNAVPPTLLLIPYVLRTSLVENVLLTAVIAGGLTTLVRLHRRGACDRLQPFLRLAWLSVVLVGIDLLRGAPWMKNSFLGYDPFLGARFYGIGNEYMGFFTGAVLMATAGSMEMSTVRLDAAMPSPFAALRSATRRSTTVRLAAVIAVYTVCAFLVFWPTLGANVGGGVTALVAFTVTAHLLWQKARPSLEDPAEVRAGRAVGGWRRWFQLLGFLAVMGLCLVGVGLWDARTSPEPSHWAQLLARLQEDGWTTAFITAQRKLQLNWRLFQFTIWSRVLVLSLVLTMWLLMWPPLSLKRVLSHYRFLTAGLQGSLLAALIALLVNDSGVVAAATSMIPATTLLLFLVSVSRRDGVQ